MSEDEQSGSNYDFRGNFRRMRLLLWALAALKPQERWSTSNRAFAVAVDRAAAKGNRFAKEFHVLTNVAGRHCPDFAEILGYARTCGMIVRSSGSYDWMDINASERLHETADGFTDEERGFASGLALEFWNQSCGVADAASAGSD